MCCKFSNKFAPCYVFVLCVKLISSLSRSFCSPLSSHLHHAISTHATAIPFVTLNDSPRQSCLLEIIIDLPLGLPINNIISLQLRESARLLEGQALCFFSVGYKIRLRHISLSFQKTNLSVYLPCVAHTQLNHWTK